jgi:asparagine synthase (glutamine-hydrolysing)
MTNLEKKLQEQIMQSIQNLVDSKTIGIAFSGGVDSSLLAKITTDLGYDVLLLTIGFDDSHDVKFSQDIAKMLGYKHVVETISTKTFPEIAERIRMIIKIDSLSWLENCIAFYYVSALAKKYGIKKILTANGIDELFCGYNSYREAISQGAKTVAIMMEKKLDNEIKMMKAVNSITSELGVHVLQPFLSKEFIEFAKKIPLDEKIHGPDDFIRKHIIRKLALLSSVPKESALKRKKALQYGSLIHQNIMKIRKTWNRIS